VLEHIVETDRADKGFGLDLSVYIPKDPGQAGVAANLFFVKHLTDYGVTARTEQSASNVAGKLQRMQPFLALAESGLVKVVKGEWNVDWYNELEDFIDGNRNQKDDMWDATATATKALLKNRQMGDVVMPMLTQASPIPSL
jgi:predicted phage terminase large subunit-like protein